jgi:hypothetical protein
MQTYNSRIFLGLHTLVANRRQRNRTNYRIFISLRTLAKNIGAGMSQLVSQKCKDLSWLGKNKNPSPLFSEEGPVKLF